MIVRDYVRNYRTNQEIVKIKEKNGDVQGIATIQLFDAKTGALELEAKTHNIIYQAVYDWLKSYQWDKFCTGAYNKTNTYDGYWEMDNIYLVASAKPESERVDIFNYDDTQNGNPGQLVGWANKATYSGSDTQRGTPNSAETYANDEKIRWVFDWPTHAANGTFQTIIWANTIGLYLAQTSITIPYENNIETSLGLAFDGTYFYVLKPNGTLYKIDQSGTIIATYNLGISVKSYGGMNLTYDGTYLYAMQWNGNIYKISTDGVVIGSPISTGIVSFGGDYYTPIGIAYLGGYFYILNYDGTLYKVTTSGSIVSQVNTGLSFSKYNGCDLACDGTYLYTTNYSGTLYKLNTSGTVVGTFDTGINAGIYSSHGLAYDGANICMAVNIGATLYKVYGTSRYFARTLLASPITKTNQNTMKVIYEFIRS